MDIKDIIRNKREHKELSEEELYFFISKYFKEEILEEQAAALLTLIYTNGITENEMAYLTNAMAETGNELELYTISNQIVDIHTVGGLSDKIVILLIVIIASLNIPIVKISGRELGMLDRLESIPNYQANIDFNQFKNIIREYGMGIFAEPTDMAPIENKMYSLRNKIACNDDISLIAMSLMSQKIAVGARNIIFHIPYGENTYTKDYKTARKLSKYLISIGKTMNRNVKCVINPLEETFGRTFGNIVEIEEIIKCLRGEMPEDIKEMILIMGSKIIELAQKSMSEKENRKKIIEVINNGKAYETFLKLLEIQGANTSIVNNISTAKQIVPVISNITGIVEKIDYNIIRKVALHLNAIRSSKEQELDIGAGIEFNKKVGDRVNSGEILAYIHTNEDTKIQKASQMIKDAYYLTEKTKYRKFSQIECIER